MNRWSARFRSQYPGNERSGRSAEGTPRSKGLLAVLLMGAWSLSPANLRAIPLPDNSSVATAASVPALKITNTGLGLAGYFLLNNAANTNTALQAQTNGTGLALFGYTTGTGRAGLLQIANAANANPALQAQTNGTGFGLYALTTGTNRAGFLRINNAANTNTAVQGETNGRGRAGNFKVTNAANTNPALQGETVGNGPGVHGYNGGSGTAGYFLNALATNTRPALNGKTNGSGPGVFGESAGGFGVIGTSARTGVQGISTGSVGNGVWGNSDADTGVFGSSKTGKGVYGIANVAGVGVYGKSASGNGVEGSSPNGFAVYGNGAIGVGGLSSSGAGIYGSSSTNKGVWGDSGSDDGVYGKSLNGTGVHGVGSGVGVHAEGGSYGITAYGSVGIYAAPTAGNTIAGLFGGNVQINGNLSKSGGSFLIDHPLDPDNRTLSHSFVESPDMMNIYNGIAVLDGKGQAEVELPNYFEALNRDFRYQLTAIGAPGPNLYIAAKIAGNRFAIGGGAPGMEVSWQVTGIRQDAWANAHRIPVEEEKTEIERGFYLHPELYGASEEKGIQWARHLKQMQNQRATREAAR